MEKNKKDELDSFWDVDLLVPKKSRPSIPRRAHDTSSISITITEDGNKYTSNVTHGQSASSSRIPPREQTDNANTPPKVNIPGLVAASELIPKKSEELSVIRTYEYDRPGKPVCHVKVSPWPVKFGFYAGFKTQAEKYFHLKCEECDFVPFAPYMLQYDNMARSQFRYFLYFRDCIRKGEFIKADSGYIFLFLYEIINLPKLAPPEKYAGIISRVWAHYRDTYGYFDRYIGEWLCDYCLIHDVNPDFDALAPFISEIGGRMSLPEFYMQSYGESLSYSRLASVSEYDYRKSRYYTENKELWDKYIPNAVEKAASVSLDGKGESDIVRISKDSYSGAVVCAEQKYNIEIQCHSLRRSHGANRIITDIIKYCENKMRAVCSVRSRFNKITLDEKTKGVLDSYFDVFFPKTRSSQKSDSDTSYLSLYEKISDAPADISRALEIEKESWETAEILEADEAETETEKKEEELPPPPIFKETDFSDGDDVYALFVSSLDEKQKDFLRSSIEGNTDKNISGLALDEMIRTLNEKATDITGDVIYENGEIIEDYFSLLSDALNG